MQVDPKLLDTLLASFETHSRAHDRDEDGLLAEVASSGSTPESQGTQMQSDCIDVLSALQVMFAKFGSELPAAALSRDLSDTNHVVVTEKLCEFLAMLLDGHACPHSPFVFDYGAPTTVRFAQNLLRAPNIV
jgi:hypothetical protein